MATKQCYTCKEDLPMESFPIRKGRGGNTYQRRDCTACMYRKNREWAARNKQYFRDRKLEKYGLTQKSFDALLKAQGGVCAICQSPDPKGHGRWCVDHDHSCCPGKFSCGKCVRGLLCSPCNTGIGHLQDNADVLRKAVDYLERGA